MNYYLFFFKLLMQKNRLQKLDQIHTGKPQHSNKNRIIEIGWRDIELFVHLSRTYLMQIEILYGVLMNDIVNLDLIEMGN